MKEHTSRRGPGRRAPSSTNCPTLHKPKASPSICRVQPARTSSSPPRCVIPPSTFSSTTWEPSRHDSTASWPSPTNNGPTLSPSICSRRSAPPGPRSGMIAAGRGTIVTISSVNASLPDPAVIDYSAAKAALTNFCKALSKEVGPYGIRVNTISPGPVSTALWLGDREWHERLRPRPAPTRRPSPNKPSPTQPPDASRQPKRSPTSYSSSPATVPRTSPAKRSSSTVG